MAKLSSEIIENIEKQGIFALATASKNGIPNVVPVGMLKVHDENTIWVVDNFFGKTLANIQENPIVSFYVWNPECKAPVQVKGNAEVVNSGADYEEAYAFAKAKKETLPAKNLIRITVSEVYSVAPGPDAGKKLC